jgi:hypothetical protein
MTFKLHHPVDHLTQWNLALGLPFGILIIGIMGWRYPLYSNPPTSILVIWVLIFGCTSLALTPIKLYIPFKLTIAALFPFFICCVIMLYALGDMEWKFYSYLLMPLWIGFNVMKLYICVPLLIIVYHSAIYWKKRQSYLTES